MEDALTVHRLHFALTVTFHYIFPQLTMGLALLIFLLKTIALGTGDEHHNRAARFWAKIFGISFALGVVTGIPMEFQFGTNWSEFSKAAGGVIGQTLAMEGVFSFFLESTFLGLFLFGEERLGPKSHWVSSLMVLLGSWLSGYFIVATDAWMQHPVGYALGPNGQFQLTRARIVSDGILSICLPIFAAYFLSRAEAVRGKDAASHFIAITDPGSKLEDFARQEGFRRVFRTLTGSWPGDKRPNRP